MSLFFTIFRILVLLSFIWKATATELYSDDNWSFSRNYPYNTNVLAFSADKVARKILYNLSFEQRYYDYPLQIWASPEKFVYLSYNVNSSPSGRRPGYYSEKFNLNILNNTGDSKRYEFSAVGAGIDDIVYLDVNEDFIHVCLLRSCFTFDTVHDVHFEWKAQIKSPLIEVVFDNLDRQAYGIVADVKGSGSYNIIKFDEENLEIVEQFKKEIPYDLRFEDGRLSYSIGKYPEDLNNVFQFDLKRFGRGQAKGISGESNLEGRVVWEKTYYLHALLSQIELQGDNDLVYLSWAKRELEELAMLCTDSYPSLYVQRYSVNREPLLFALHLGLFSNLLKRFESVIGEEKLVDKCSSWIEGKLLSLDATVEEMGEYVESSSGESVCCTLYYKKGIPFWADGVNVPLNYISGTLIGLSTIDDPIARKNISNLSKMVVTEVYNNPMVFERGGWRYWMFLGWRGWSEADNLSINTPNYPGKRDELAHISYRSIDALSLIKCYEIESCLTGVSNIEFMKFIADLVDERVVNLYLLESGKLRDFLLNRGGFSSDGLLQYVRSYNRIGLREAFWASYIIENL